MALARTHCLRYTMSMVDASREKGVAGGSAPRATLLAIGDMHLGVRPSGVPDLGSFDQTCLTPATALANAVDLAIEKEVDAVLFAGDLVESANARFEALRPLEDAINRLAAANIRVLAVVGNHDSAALPALARTIDGLELIGEGGEWESKTIEVDGEPAVEIMGWSFPAPHYPASPLASLLEDPLPQRGLPRIGLLHGDLDGSGEYAPFRRSELEAAGLDGWLLGHIHKPTLGMETMTGGVPFGYLGSLVGLDGGEPGSHGPWLVSIGQDGGLTCEQSVTAPLRWEEVELELATDTTSSDLGDLLMEETKRAAVSLHERGLRPRALGLRITVVGAVSTGTDLREWIARRENWKELGRAVEETEVFIHKISARLELALGLDKLALENSPAGLLAKDIVALDGNGERREALLAAARARLGAEVEKARWQEVHKMRNFSDPLTDEALAERLRRAGTRALTALLAGRELGDGDTGADSQVTDSRSQAGVSQ
ncbi:MAG TPA: DNA repair exonuclease [Planctomycetota bacterium]|nr:DNA repair exonuclease [Planctomycetota bacterium]